MIEPRYVTLQQLFSNRVFRIPPYQRFYSWEQKQREDLFADLSALSDGEQDQHHFMATLVCHRTGETAAVSTTEYGVYDVVDGQQRLTTLIILLKCIELALPPDSFEKAELSRILVKRDGNVVLLQSNNTNGPIFHRFLIDGSQPKSDSVQTYSDKTLAQAIKECSAFVSSWDAGTTRQLTQLIRLILNRLGFVVHDTDNARTVYTLFEVLNSRGLAVDWLDKTKSMLMGSAYDNSGSPEAAATAIELLQQSWGQIYREMAKEKVTGDELLAVTATLYYGPGKGKLRRGDDALGLLRSQCLTDRLAPSLISDRLWEVARSLTRLHGNRALSAVTRIKQARLLAVAIDIARGINDAERELLRQQWERVTFRIFGLHKCDARKKVGDYVKLGHSIVTEDVKTRSCNQILAALRYLGDDFPVEDAVSTGLCRKDLYKDSPEVCRYILWHYEEYLAELAGNCATLDEHERQAIWSRRPADSIEHIFPQTVKGNSDWWRLIPSSNGDQEWPEQDVGRIGNLLLLPPQSNSEASNFPFSRKKEVYRKHRLRMIDEICIVPDWTLSAIDERESRIMTWARARWADI